ncbi:unnamed protein product, partial [Echinostoma caproni]|uniref:Uncharacterized protein n=1 Tax=Echinostoma caproni TaxID=27848 RepID=A0A183ALH5_9TREM
MRRLYETSGSRWAWEASLRPSFAEVHAELEQMYTTMNIEAEVARELEKRQAAFSTASPSGQPTRGPSETMGDPACSGRFVDVRRAGSMSSQGFSVPLDSSGVAVPTPRWLHAAETAHHPPRIGHPSGLPNRVVHEGVIRSEVEDDDDIQEDEGDEDEDEEGEFEDSDEEDPRDRWRQRTNVMRRSAGQVTHSSESSQPVVVVGARSKFSINEASNAVEGDSSAHVVDQLRNQMQATSMTPREGFHVCSNAKSGRRDPSSSQTRVFASQSPIPITQGQRYYTPPPNVSNLSAVQSHREPIPDDLMAAGASASKQRSIATTAAGSSHSMNSAGFSRDKGDRPTNTRPGRSRVCRTRGASATHSSATQNHPLNGTTRSRDTDTPDESGVGESIISNDSPADSGGGVIGSAPPNVPTSDTRAMALSASCKTVDNPSAPNAFVQAKNSYPANLVSQSSVPAGLPSHGTFQPSPSATGITTSSVSAISTQATTRTVSQPALRLDAEAMDQFATLPPQDRIGRYLESLNEIGSTVNSTPSTQAQPRLHLPRDIGEQPLNTNSLFFLQYPPPPPPPLPEHNAPVSLSASQALHEKEFPSDSNPMIASYLSETQPILETSSFSAIRSQNHEPGARIADSTHGYPGGDGHSVCVGCNNTGNTSNCFTKDGFAGSKHHRIGNSNLPRQRRHPKDGHDSDAEDRRPDSLERSGEESNTEEVTRSGEEETLSLASESPSPNGGDRDPIHQALESTGTDLHSEEHDTEVDDVYQAPEACYSMIAASCGAGVTPAAGVMHGNDNLPKSLSALISRLELLIRDLVQLTHSGFDSATGETGPDLALLQMTDTLDAFRAEVEAYVVCRERNLDGLPTTVLHACDTLGRQTSLLAFELGGADVSISVDTSDSVSRRRSDIPWSSLRSSVLPALEDLLKHLVRLSDVESTGSRSEISVHDTP